MCSNSNFESWIFFLNLSLTSDFISFASLRYLEYALCAFSYFSSCSGILFFICSAWEGKSAKDRLDELIYTHGYCVENVTINAVPVYYL